MDKKSIIRAWKDPEYRASLEEAPLSPAGVIELEDTALESAAGGLLIRRSSGYICTLTAECRCPGPWTW